jgi:guanylate kinase
MTSIYSRMHHKSCDVVTGSNSYYNNYREKKQSNKTDLNAQIVFIKSPPLEVLRERLCGRNIETCNSIQARLKAANELKRFT